MGLGVTRSLVGALVIFVIRDWLVRIKLRRGRYGGSYSTRRAGGLFFLVGLPEHACAFV